MSFKSLNHDVPSLTFTSQNLPFHWLVTSRFMVLHVRFPPKVSPSSPCQTLGNSQMDRTLKPSKSSSFHANVWEVWIRSSPGSSEFTLGWSSESFACCFDVHGPRESERHHLGVIYFDKSWGKLNKKTSWHRTQLNKTKLQNAFDTWKDCRCWCVHTSLKRKKITTPNQKKTHLQQHILGLGHVGFVTRHLRLFDPGLAIASFWRRRCLQTDVACGD